MQQGLELGIPLRLLFWNDPDAEPATESASKDGEDEGDDDVPILVECTEVSTAVGASSSEPLRLNEPD